MNKLITVIAAASLTALTFGASAASSAALAKQAKVQMPQAREIALKTYPGKIVKEELEKEKGGSGLRYSFDIKDGKVAHEVGVDARTGKVLENSVDHGND
ncbi:MAG: PepSY domain-containing protein [Rhodanobacter sp.]